MYALCRTRGASPATGRSRPISIRTGSRQVLAGHPVDPGRHGGREEHRLPLRRGVLQDRLDVLGEAHVEHLVGLVEHHAWPARPGAACPGRCGPGPGPGWPPPRPRRGRGRAAAGRSAGRRRSAAPGRPGPCRSGGTPRRPARPAPGWAPAPAPPGRRRCRSCRHPLQQRQRERGGLAGAGRRLPQQVPARQQRRDRLPLDRGRLLVAERGRARPAARRAARDRRRRSPRRRRRGRRGVGRRAVQVRNSCAKPFITPAGPSRRPAQRSPPTRSPDDGQHHGEPDDGVQDGAPLGVPARHQPRRAGGAPRPADRAEAVRIAREAGWL